MVSKLDVVLTDDNGMGIFRGEPVKVVFRELESRHPFPWLTAKHRETAALTALAAKNEELAREIASEGYILHKEAEKARVVEFFTYPFDDLETIAKEKEQDTSLEIDDPLWRIACGFRNGGLFRNFETMDEKAAAMRLAVSRDREDIAHMVRRTPVVEGEPAVPRICMHEKFRHVWEPWRSVYYLSGRGAGKSWGVTIAFLLIALSERAFLLMTRETETALATSSRRNVLLRMEELGLRNWFRITERSIKCIPTGSEFIFYGLHRDAGHIRSTEGITHVFVDEAHDVKRKSIDVLDPTVRVEGSKIIYGMNPEDEKQAVYTDAHMGYSNCLTIRMSYKENPNISSTIARRALDLKALNFPAYLHTYGGLLYKNENIRVFQTTDWAKIPKGHDMRAPLDIDGRFRFPGVPEHAVRIAGADWGFSTDPNALFVGWIWEHNIYVEFARYKFASNFHALPGFFAGSDVLDPPRWENPGGDPGVEGIMFLNVVGDSESPGVINYLKELGFKISKAKKGQGSKKDGLQFLLGHMIWVPEEFKEMTREFEMCAYKTDSHTGLATSDIADGYDHLLDSMRYATEAHRRAPETSLDLDIPFFRICQVGE